jgi:hypothetical protein
VESFFYTLMQMDLIKPGDKLSFLWQPGYRGPLRDGETVVVLSIQADGIKVRYRLNQEELLQAAHLYRPSPSH